MEDEEGQDLNLNREDQSENTTTTEDVIWEQIENLREKRSATRLKALTYLSNALRNLQHMEFLAERSTTLISYATTLVKKPSSSEEAVAACSFLSLIALGLREEGAGEELLTQTWPILLPLLKNPAKDTASRVAAVQTSGILAWMDSVADALEEKERDEIMDSFENLIKPETPPDVLRAAIDALTLQLTLRPEAQLAGSLFKKFVTITADLLSHPTLEVRSSAGELLALIQEAAFTCEVPDVGVVDEEEVDMDLVLDKLHALVTESTRRQTKKDRAKQKSFFRLILATVEESETPTEKLDIFKTTHEFEGWRIILQLHHMRKTLEGGLVQHLAKNPILQDIFEVDYTPPEQEENLTAQQKKSNRKARQNDTKYQHQELAKQRKKKQAMRAAFDD